MARRERSVLRSMAALRIISIFTPAQTGLTMTVRIRSTTALYLNMIRKGVVIQKSRAQARLPACQKGRAGGLFLIMMETSDENAEAGEGTAAGDRDAVRGHAGSEGACLQ